VVEGGTDPFPAALGERIERDMRVEARGRNAAILIALLGLGSAGG
jgi:hypothetical protein